MNTASLAETFVPAVVGSLLGSLGSFIFTRALWRAFVARRWPTVTGTITSCETRVIRRGGGPSTSGPGRRTHVTYRYAVGGQPFEGQRIGLGDAWDASASTAADVAKRYPVGAEVTVRYDPQTPSSAVLEPNAGWLAWTGALGCTALVVSLLVELARHFMAA